MESDPRKSRDYARANLRLSLLSGGVELALLAVFLVSGASVALARWVPGGSAWRVLAYTFLVGAGFKLVSLPFELWGRGIEIRFGMNRQSLGSWWLDQLKGVALAAILGLGAAEAVYALLRGSPHHWWLWAWIAMAGLYVVLALLGPVVLLPLFFKLRQMSNDDPSDGPLVERLEGTYARLRAQNPKLPRLHGIFEWKLGEKSAKANAALTGLGRTRRVIISDTLLESSPVEEIEAVFIHELGHHVHRDIWRGLAFQSALGLLGFWLAQELLRGMAPRLGLYGVSDIAGLPLLLLVFSVLGLILLPVSNGFVRVMERRADDYSFNTLGTAQPLMAGLQRLADKNLAEVSPPRWKEWLLYSHPSISTRIRRGEEWERCHGAALGLR